MSHGLQTKLLWKNNNLKLIRSLTDGKETPESEYDLDLEKVDNYKVFYVDRILRIRLKKNIPFEKYIDHIDDAILLSFEYLIKWYGFGHQHNTWEPYENLGSTLKNSAKNAVKKFLAKHKNNRSSLIKQFEDTNECEPLKHCIDNTYEWDSLKTTLKNTVNYLKDLEDSRKETNNNNTSCSKNNNLEQTLYSNDGSAVLFHDEKSDTDDKTTNTNTVDHLTFATPTISTLTTSNCDIDNSMKKRKIYYDKDNEKLRAKYLKLKKENFPPCEVIGKKKNKSSKKRADEINPVKKNQLLNRNNVICSPYCNSSSSSKEKWKEHPINGRNEKISNFKYNPLNEEKNSIKVLKNKSDNMNRKIITKHTKMQSKKTALVPFSKDYKNKKLIKKRNTKEDRQKSSNDILVYSDSHNDYLSQRSLSALSDISEHQSVSVKNGFHKSLLYNMENNCDCNEQRYINDYDKQDEYKKREIHKVPQDTMITNFEDKKNSYIVFVSGEEWSLYQKVHTIKLKSSELFKNFIETNFFNKSLENRNT